MTTPDGNITTVQTAKAIRTSRRPAAEEDQGRRDDLPGTDCVFPSPITITSGAYPLSRRFYLFTSRQSLSATARAYARRT